jgi:hypothetical protein
MRVYPIPADRRELAMHNPRVDRAVWISRAMPPYWVPRGHRVLRIVIVAVDVTTTRGT